MKMDIRKGDDVEMMIVKGGKEFPHRGRVVDVTSDFVVVTRNTTPSRKSTGTTSGTLQYSIGLIEGRGHACMEVFSISYHQFLVIWNLDR